MACEAERFIWGKMMIKRVLKVGMLCDLWSPEDSSLDLLMVFDGFWQGFRWSVGVGKGFAVQAFVRYGRLK